MSSIGVCEMQRLSLLVLLLPAGLLVASPPSGPSPHGLRHGRELYVVCRLDAKPEPVVAEAVLELASPMEAADLDQTIEFAPPVAPIRLTKYLPQAECEQSFVAGEGPGTNPGIELVIKGPTQSYQQWLVANDTERNRLISLIGKWRYMAVADKAEREELFAQFENELTGKPTLRISKPDGGDPVTLPVEPGATRKLPDLGCTIRVQSFFPHFGIHEMTKQPANMSDRRLNPAALVEIERNGKKETQWVFAKFPGFRAEKLAGPPFEMALDCPLENQDNTPDFALVSVGSDGHELWRHENGKSTAKPIAIDEPTEVPGSQYAFHIAKFVPAGRLVEEYHPAEGRSAVPALRIETTDAAGEPTILWLEFGKPRIISTAKGPMSIVFGPRSAESSGGQRWPHSS